jgi:hypothetical protein
MYARYPHHPLKGDATNYEVVPLQKGIAVYDNQSYLLGDVKPACVCTSDSTSVDVKNAQLIAL